MSTVLSMEKVNKNKLCYNSKMKKEAQRVIVHVDPKIDILKLNSNPLHSHLIREEAKTVLKVLKNMGIIDEDSY